MLGLKARHRWTATLASTAVLVGALTGGALPNVSAAVVAQDVLPELCVETPLPSPTPSTSATSASTSPSPSVSASVSPGTSESGSPSPEASLSESAPVDLSPSELAPADPASTQTAPAVDGLRLGDGEKEDATPPTESLPTDESSPDSGSVPGPAPSPEASTTPDPSASPDPSIDVTAPPSDEASPTTLPTEAAPPSPSASSTDDVTPSPEPTDTSEGSDETVTNEVCPESVTGVRASGGLNSATVSWDMASSGTITDYVVVVLGQDRLLWVDAATPSTTVSGLRNGVEYQFAVYAVSDLGRSVPSDVVSAVPSTGVEGEVAGLIVGFENGVNVSSGQAVVPGEQVIDSVDLTMAGQIGEGIHTVELSEAVSLAEAETIADELQATGDVAWAEPDQFVFTSAVDSGVAVPDDTQYRDSQWNLWDTYGIGVGNGSGSMTSAYSPDTGAGATVAVIDTGIVDHPDLRSALVPGFDFVSDPESLAAARTTGAEPVAFDADGTPGWDADPTDPGDWRGVTPVRDSSWHGTLVAGVIAAQANNAEGVVGVVPGAKVSPIRALSWRGGLMSDIASAITWASGGHVDGAVDNANPSDVINLSFAVEASCSVALQSAITGATERGSVVVAAAGNAGSNVSGFAPANCADVIAVGATGRDGKRAPYSNFGDGIDVSAPGGSGTGTGGVLTTSNEGVTTSGSPAYRATEGTSIAAAHVSSAAAYLAAAEPDLTPTQIRTRLTGKESVRAFADDTCDTDAAKTCGAGIIDLAQIAAAGVPGIDVNLSVTDSGTTTLLADGSTVANGDTVTVGAAGLLSPGVGDREIRTTLDSTTVYESGSAVAPEGWTVNYTANNGTSWSSSEPSPASSVTDVRATATDVAAGLIEGTSQIYSSETTSSVPSSTFLANAGGDGYNAFFYDDYVFNIFHHNSNTYVMCHLKADSTRCPGFSSPFTVSGYQTSMRSTGWVDAVTGRLYSIGTKSGSAWAVCIDVSTSSPFFCGATELATGSINDYTHIGEGVAHGRRYFGTESAGTNSLMCFDAATGAKCPGTPISLVGASTTSGGNMSMTRVAVLDDYVFVTTSNTLYCFDPDTLATCSGSWPVSISPWSSSGTAMGLAPHVDGSEALDGVCYYRSDTPYTCVDLTGAPSATWKSPFGLGRPAHPHIAMGVETLGRFYYGSGQYQVGCWDYTTQASCANFPKTFPGSVRIVYGVSLDPQNPACIWMNSDAGYIYNFDAYSGDYGCDSNPVITLQPSQFAPRYACSTADGITEWSQLRLVSTSGGGSASSVGLTVRTATGAVVSGWSSVPVSVGGSLDMTGLDPAVSGSRPTFSFAFSGVTGTISTAVIALDYKGKGPELCVDTTATSASPPEDASVTGTLTENLGLEESFTQTRTFRIGSSASIVEQTVPGAPRAVTGSGLNTSASLTFQPPADDGGLPITSYAISTSGGSSWSTASEVDNGDGTYTVSISGLTPGSTYDMRLAAVNDMGRGASASVSVTAQLLSIGALLDTPVNQGPLTLASTTDGGLPLTYTSSSESVCSVSGVTVTLLTEGTCVLVAHQAGDASADPIILPADTEGSFTVLGAYYEPTLPGVPTGLTLAPADGQVSVSWTAPSSDGYSAITDYIVQYKSGGTWIPFADGTSTSTSAIVAGLTNGTTYSFRVAAVNAVGTGSYTSSDTAVPATTPGAPTSLSASVTGTSASLSWSAPSSTGGSAITDYVVEYKLSTEGAWSTFTDGTSTSTSASVSGLTSGADYDFQVTTVNAVGEGGSTSTVNLTATAGNGETTLAWSAPASPGGTIIDYQMQYRTPAGSWSTFTDTVTTTTGGTVTGLTNGTSYYFRVATILTGDVTSSFTSVVSATPRTTPDSPEVTATPGNRQVTLTWPAPGAGGSAITDYVIQYKASTGSTWSTLVDGTSTTRSAAVTGLTNGTSFDFRVASTNVVGTSGYSATVSATPRTTPDAPTAVTAVTGDGQITLTWTAAVDNGGAAVTDFSVQYMASGGYSWTSVTRTASTTASQVVTGLANGTSYVFRVAAINAAGTGTYATAVSGTPVTTPGTPRSVSATVTGTDASITWTAPLSDGGSAITDYEVDYRATSDSVWTVWTHSASSATTAALTALAGLDTGTRYEVRVRAVNAVGTGGYASATFPDVESETPTESGTSGSGSSPGGSTEGTSSLPSSPLDPPTIGADEAGAVLIDGVLMSLDITPPGAGGSTWSVAGPDFSLQFTPQQVGGSNQLVGATSGLSSPPGGWIQVVGDGYQGGTQVKVYAIPRPKTRASVRAASSAVFLGLADVPPDGRFDIRVTLPDALATGDYVLQVNGLSPESSVRSVNMALSVNEETGTSGSEASSSAEATSLSKSTMARMKSRAFFKARSAAFSPLGVRRMRAIVKEIPRGTTGVVVKVTGVSVGLDSISENLALASRRAETVVGYLRKRGIEGTYTVNVTATEGITGPTTTPDSSLKRKRPYTTATIIYRNSTQD